MKFDLKGPLPFHLDMNGLMLAGSVVGIAGLGARALAAMGLFEGSAKPFDQEGTLGHLTASDICIGVALAGMALYFLGRVVHIVAMLRKRR